MSPAEYEIEILRLREALFQAKRHLNIESAQWEQAEEALSTPPSTPALAALVEKVERRTIERCMQTCSDLGKRGIDYYQYATFITAINALPVGQTKLEELL